MFGKLFGSKQDDTQDEAANTPTNETVALGVPVPHENDADDVSTNATASKPQSPQIPQGPVTDTQRDVGDMQHMYARARSEIADIMREPHPEVVRNDTLAAEHARQHTLDTATENEEDTDEQDITQK